MKVFDPRSGGDFRWHNATIGEYSSLQRDVLVVDDVPVPVFPFEEAVRLVAGGGRTCGAAVVFDPWWPGVERRRSAFRRSYPDSYAVGSALVAAERGLDALRRGWNLRKEIGGNVSGLWCLGLGVFEDLLGVRLDSTRIGQGPPVDWAVSLMPPLSAAICIDEGDAVTALFSLPTLGEITEAALLALFTSEQQKPRG